MAEPTTLFVGLDVHKESIARRLERTHGPEAVEAAYRALSSEAGAQGPAGGPASARRAARKQYQLRARRPT